MATDAPSVWPELLAALRREGVRGFPRWCWTGFVQAMPPRFRALLWPLNAIVLTFDSPGWVVHGPDGSGGNAAGKWGGAGAQREASRESFAKFLDGFRPGLRNVWVVLAEGEVVVRSVVLPMAAELELRSALSLDLDRLSPMPADKAAFDFRVVRRDTESRVLEVELVIAPLRVIEARVQELRGLGARVLGVSPPGGFWQRVTPLNLLPAEGRDKASMTRLMVATRVLAAAALVLGCAALALPIKNKRDLAISLQPLVEKSKAEAAASEALAKDVERLAGDYNFILGRKYSQASMRILLEQLARELPDDTWVQQLDVETKAAGKSREVKLAGETGSSSGLIAAIERTGMLANAAFKAPLTKGSSANVERFLVSAELKPGLSPEPIPLAGAAKGEPGPAKIDPPPAPPAATETSSSQ